MPRAQCLLPKKQLTIAEQVLLDTMLRQEGACVKDAWQRISADRLAKKVQPLHISNVYRFAKGLTHKRCSTETRGRKRTLSGSDIRTLETTRRKLLRTADSEHRVTYADIAEESGLGDKASLRTHAQALRDLGVRFRRPREKVCITAEDAKKRLRTAKLLADKGARIRGQQIISDAFDHSAESQVQEDTRHGPLEEAFRGCREGFHKATDAPLFLGCTVGEHQRSSGKRPGDYVVRTHSPMERRDRCRCVQGPAPQSNDEDLGQQA